MSVGAEMVDVYNFDVDNIKGTATMLRSTFVPVAEVIEQKIGGGKSSSVFSLPNPII